MKTKSILVLTGMVMSQIALAQSGVGGGDSCKNEINRHRESIQGWIIRDEAKELDFSLALTPGLIYQNYKQSMLAVLQEGKVIVTCFLDPSRIKDPAAQIIAAKEGVSYKAITIGNPAKPTACINYEDQNGNSHIDCNYDTIVNQSSLDNPNFVMTHHEYASIAGIEKRTGSYTSDLSISNQISNFERWAAVKLLGPKQSNSVQILAHPEEARPCPMPNPNASIAFNLIENPSVSQIENFLSTHIVAKDARNEKCETMYAASIRARNERARNYLDSIGYGPSNAEEINRINFSLSPSYYEQVLRFGSWETIQLFKSKGGALSKSNPVTELNIAIQYNQLDVINTLLKTDVNVNGVDQNGYSPMMSAVMRNEIVIVELLIKNGALINSSSNLLTIASKQGSKELIALLIRAGINVNQTCSNNTTPLIEASRSNSPDVVELLISAGTYVNEECNNTTALIEAAAINSPNGFSNLQLLLKAGAFVNALKTKALDKAADTSNLPAVELLIQAGANASCTDLIAFRMGGEKKELIETLLRLGICKSDNEFVYWRALKLINLTEYKDYLSKGFFDPNFIDQNSENILMIAIGANADFKIIQYMINSKSVDLNYTVNSALRASSVPGDWRAINFAVAYGRPDVIRYLVSKGVNVNGNGYPTLASFFNPSLRRKISVEDSKNVIATLLDLGASKTVMFNYNGQLRNAYEIFQIRPNNYPARHSEVILPLIKP